MSVNALFYVSAVNKTARGVHEITLHPVTRSSSKTSGEYEPDGNKDWSKYTPAGQITLSVYSDLPAAKWFEERLGQDVPLTFG